MVFIVDPTASSCGSIGTDVDISCTHVVAVVKSHKATQVNLTGSAITFVKEASPRFLREFLILASSRRYIQK